jgi:hypothetical protein
MKQSDYTRETGKENDEFQTATKLSILNLEDGFSPAI